MTGLIAAFDISKTRTGWCFGVPLRQPVFGSFSLSGETDEVYHRLHKRVWRLFEEHRPNQVFFEQPFTGRNPKTARILHEMCGAFQLTCRLYGVPVFEVPIATWRKHFLGTNHFRREDAKRASVTRCRQLGLTPQTDDEADAIGIWDYASSLKSSAHSIRTAPLFSSTSEGGSFG